jgi:hypothetical protein
LPVTPELAWSLRPFQGLVLGPDLLGRMLCYEHAGQIRAFPTVAPGQPFLSRRAEGVCGG